MNSQKDIRWQQRFSNLEKVFLELRDITNRDVMSMKNVEIAGYIHLFDLCFELSWKTMRDYMIYQDESDPLDFTREVLTAALRKNIIHHGDIWIEMLRDRSSSTHEYDHTAAQQTIVRIQQAYISELSLLYEYFSHIIRQA